MPTQPEWQALAAFIQQNLSTEPGRAVGEETPLLSSGLVDSFSVAALMSHIETQYGVTIPARAKTEANFDSVQAILRLVESLR